ncbi:MAG: secondary thiamine-phosphate synthase enzyme YjbQ [bacterium]
MLEEITVRTHERVAFIKITQNVKKIVNDQGIQQGVVHIYVPHTTAGVTINEGADPDVVRDMIKEFNKIVPFEDDYLHREGNSAAHIKSSLMGSSATVFIQNRQLVLGTWQDIFFCEFDGPRSRRIMVHVS